MVDRTLLDAFLDDALTAGQEQEFAAWLRADPHHVTLVVQALHLERGLTDAVLAHRSGSGRPTESGRIGAPLPSAPSPRSERARRQRSPRWPWITRVAAAAGLAITLMAALLWSRAGSAVHPAPVESAMTVATVRVEGTGCRLLSAGVERACGGAPVRIHLGDQLHCLPDGRATLRYDDGSLLHVAPNSICVIDGSPLQPERKAVRLTAGRIDATIAKQAWPMIFTTPLATARVVGTRLTLVADPDATRLEVADGVVDLVRTRDQATVRVSAGQAARAGVGVDLVATALPAAGRQLSAGPEDYEQVVGTLRAGDTLTLASGDYRRSWRIDGVMGTDQAPIVIRGPPTGGPAVFIASAGENTLEITDTCHLELMGLVFDGRHTPNVIAIATGTARPVHDLRIDGCEIRDYDGNQRATAILCRCPAWNWTVHGNRILRCGTGMLLGDDGGTLFANGHIEGNAVIDCIGCCLRVAPRDDARWTAQQSLATRAAGILIRDNVLIKGDQPSPDGDRPSLLLDGDSAGDDAASRRCQVLGNFIDHNPRESLIQACGEVSIHDNLLVDSGSIGIALRAHETRPLRSAAIYHNTICGVRVGIACTDGSPALVRIVANAIFAPTAIDGVATQEADNLIGPPAAAAMNLRSPVVDLPGMDLHPCPGRCSGGAADLTPFAGDVDARRDFAGDETDDDRRRGAYAPGSSGGWMPSRALKPGR